MVLPWGGSGQLWTNQKEEAAAAADFDVVSAKRGNWSELKAAHGSAAVVWENSKKLFPVLFSFFLSFPVLAKKTTTLFYTGADLVPEAKWFLLNRTTVLVSSAGLRDSGCRGTFVAFGSTPSFFFSFGCFFFFFSFLSDLHRRLVRNEVCTCIRLCNSLHSRPVARSKLSHQNTFVFWGFFFHNRSIESLFLALCTTLCQRYIKGCSVCKALGFVAQWCQYAAPSETCKGTRMHGSQMTHLPCRKFAIFAISNIDMHRMRLL